MAMSGATIAADISPKTVPATFSVRSLRTPKAVRANRLRGRASVAIVYFFRMPRITRSAVRLTTKVMEKSRTPVRNSTR